MSSTYGGIPSIKNRSRLNRVHDFELVPKDYYKEFNVNDLTTSISKMNLKEEIEKKEKTVEDELAEQMSGLMKKRVRVKKEKDLLPTRFSTRTRQKTKKFDPTDKKTEDTKSETAKKKSEIAKKKSETAKKKSEIAKNEPSKKKTNTTKTKRPLIDETITSSDQISNKLSTIFESLSNVLYEIHNKKQLNDDGTKRASKKRK